MITVEVNQRIGIIATSGAGKSTAAYTLLEDLRNRKFPICVLDVKNEYGGLPQTHTVYASQTNAAKLVQALKKTNSSCIVFMKDLSLKKKQKWIAKFLLECHRTPRDIPLMIIIEEVRLFAPQKKNPRSKEPIEDLAQGGRSQGYGCMLISQSCSNVEKDVLRSLTDLFIMKHTLKQDQDYLKSFIGKEKAMDLPALKKGQCYHVNFENSTITEAQFPNNPRKKAGATVAPVPVEPTSLDLGKKKQESSGDGDKWILVTAIIGAIIIMVGILVIIYFYIKKNEEGENAPG